MAQVVEAHHVIHHTDSSSRRAIRNMMDTLTKQGQIEPLQVKLYYRNPEDGYEAYITCQEDVHGADIVRAARELGWPTLLITVVDRYEA